MNAAGTSLPTGNGGEPPKDWTRSVATSFGRDLAATLQRLDPATLQRYPPPRTSGLPFGHEWRILRRFVAGESSMLDPSGLSPLYLAGATADRRALYRAFAMGEMVPRTHWERWLSPSELTTWRHAGLLSSPTTTDLACAFRTISLRGVTVVADSLHSGFPWQVYIGLDSLDLVEFMARHAPPLRGRTLDVGPGTGVVLFACHRDADSSVGVEINPRAVAACRFNSTLNGQKVELLDADVFDTIGTIGQFDFVTWNVPFVFLPDGLGDSPVGDGGEYGIDLTLRFLAVLPELLSRGGQAFLLTQSPILDGRESLLTTKLIPLAHTLGFDISMHILKSSMAWKPLVGFHSAHGIRSWESVVLHVTRAEGRVRRVLPSRPTRGVDAVRGIFHRIGILPDG